MTQIGFAVRALLKSYIVGDNISLKGKNPSTDFKTWID